MCRSFFSTECIQLMISFTKHTCWFRFKIVEGWPTTGGQGEYPYQKGREIDQTFVKGVFGVCSNLLVGNNVHMQLREVVTDGVRVWRGQALSHTIWRKYSYYLNHSQFEKTIKSRQSVNWVVNDHSRDTKHSAILSNIQSKELDPTTFFCGLFMSMDGPKKFIVLQRVSISIVLENCHSVRNTFSMRILNPIIFRINFWYIRHHSV